MRYKKQIDGEWVRPRRKNYYMRCCGCGLVHRINFRINKRHIEFQAFRLKGKDNEQTKHSR